MLTAASTWSFVAGRRIPVDNRGLTALIRALRSQYQRLHPVKVADDENAITDLEYVRRYSFTGLLPEHLRGRLLPPDSYYRTVDSPNAKGRTPQSGDRMWVLHFPLDDGSHLHLCMGHEDQQRFRAWVLQEEIDDYADEVTREL